MKKLTRFLMLILSVVMLFSAWGCGGTESDSGKSDLEYTDSYLIKNGRTDYVIVYEPMAKTFFMDFAVSDFQNILKNATNVSIKALPDTDESVVWSKDAKYISLGYTKLLEAAGIEVDCDELLEGGRVVKTVGNSLFIVGGSMSYPRAVYDIMYDLFDYEYFHEDEISLTTTEADIRLPKYDYKKIPSIDALVAGYGGAGLKNGRENAIRSNTTYQYDAVFPNSEKMAGGTWHNILGHLSPSKEDTKCLPKLNADLAALSKQEFIAKYSQNIYNILTDDDPKTTVTLNDMHPTWYSNQQLAYAAKESREELLDYTFEAWQGVVNDCFSPEGMWYNYASGSEFCFSFTPMDTGTWSTSEDSLESLAKYGANTAEYVIFMNEVLTTRFNPWAEETYPDKRIKVLFFAYQAGTEAPILKDPNGDPIFDENGNYIPVSEDVMLAENLTLMYAPVRQSFYHSFIEEENKAFYETLRAWQSCFIESSELSLWLYLANYEDYGIPLDVSQNWYANAKWAAENKVMYAYFAANGGIKSMGGWSRLIIYLSGKFSENIDCNVDELTKHFFKNYFKDAADVMYKYYGEYRAWFAHLAETTDLDWLYLTEPQQANRDNWPYALLNQWIEYTEEAEQIISRYKTEDPALYKKLHDRIMLESVQPRYLMLKSYSGRLDDKNAFALSLLNDAMAAGWDMLSDRNSTIDVLKGFMD